MSPGPARTLAAVVAEALWRLRRPARYAGWAALLLYAGWTTAAPALYLMGGTP